MNLPIPLPDWVPWWVPLALLVPCLLYALAFLFMPFSVIGMKSRLEAIEARLDEIQGEIRSLSLRMPERAARAHFDELYTAPVSAAGTVRRPSRSMCGRLSRRHRAMSRSHGRPGREPTTGRRYGRTIHGGSRTAVRRPPIAASRISIGLPDRFPASDSALRPTRAGEPASRS